MAHGPLKDLGGACDALNTASQAAPAEVAQIDIRKQNASGRGRIQAEKHVADTFGIEFANGQAGVDPAYDMQVQYVARRQGDFFKRDIDRTLGHALPLPLKIAFLARQSGFGLDRGGTKGRAMVPGPARIVQQLLLPVPSYAQGLKCVSITLVCDENMAVVPLFPKHKSFTQIRILDVVRSGRGFFGHSCARWLSPHRAP